MNSGENERADSGQRIIVKEITGSRRALRTGEGGLGPLSDLMGRNKVKPEQVSKVRMRMPTLRSFGEGCTRGEVIDTRTSAIQACRSFNFFECDQF
jgi:hypothetical protein